MKWNTSVSETEVGIIIKSLLKLGEEKITIIKKEGSYQISTPDKSTNKTT